MLLNILKLQLIEMSFKQIYLTLLCVLIYKMCTYIKSFVLFFLFHKFQCIYLFSNPHVIFQVMKSTILSVRILPCAL